MSGHQRHSPASTRAHPAVEKLHPRSQRDLDLPIATDMIGIEIDPARIISQHIIPEQRACVPSCILNALRFGPPSFQKIFKTLPGDSDAEKLQNLIVPRGSIPSEVQRGARLFGSGVLMDDVATYFNSLLPSPAEHLTGCHFDITADEKPGAHLRRIHSLLASSLRQGIPIVSMVCAYSATDGKGDAERWERTGQHAILVVGVSSEIALDARGFVLRFVEPAAGNPAEGYVYSETGRAFRALKPVRPGFVYSETAKAFVPMPGLEYRWVDNGFLHLVSPSLNLGTHSAPWHARTFMTLSHGLGRFDPPKK